VRASPPYESEFADLVRVPDAVAFGFGRHAIAAVLDAAGLAAGDEVILSSFTCKVVPLSILELGLTPVYVDIDSATFNLDADRVADAIGERTRAVFFQHTYGNPAGLARVAEIASEAGLLLVEDRAQTLPCAGAVPQLGVASVYSNNLLKPLPAGSGGLAAILDGGLATRVRSRRDRLPAPSASARFRHGLQVFVHDHLFGPRLYWPLLELTRRVSPSYRPRSLEEEVEGEMRRTARRPSVSQLRRGSDSLREVEAIAAHSSGLCERYEHALEDIGALSLPIRNARHPLYYYPVLTEGIEEKDRLLRAARSANVELISWPARTPIYPVLADAELARYGYAFASCPRSESLARRVVCLPTHRKIGPRIERRLTSLLAEFATEEGRAA
jgi:dTDP-4-amino-4,6-dideoxygalactose transaminase